ncbi:unnamed protein product [Knipowitschia caucasica]|uniref:Claudin 34 n=1 Tax=Knipowitschia caucasica TaxID=637954 RepID=A0AAV2KTX3_KNICA
MQYIAHTAHCQFLGLVLGFLSWILTLTTVGLNEWRVWFVSDTAVVDSGVAWVGIWRACFYSHVLSDSEFCQYLDISEAFLPAEIRAAQVLMMLAVMAGLAGNVTAAFAMRMAYFSVENRSRIRLLFLLAGTTYVFSSCCSLLPLVLNLNSVLNNRTIDFPPQFHFPAAPVRQRVGSAIGVGLFASSVMLLSGLVFLSYRYAWRELKTEVPKDHVSSSTGNKGRDNPSFHFEEVS